MLSAEDIVAVKTAVEICNKPELKREILGAPGSIYDTNKKRGWYDRKKQWRDIVEKKVSVMLENSDLEEQKQGKVTSIAISVGMRMLTWAAYHEGTLGLLREYSVNFLNKSFFTEEGLIDNKKAAEELMKDNDLSVQQKYKLSCLYCFTEDIPALYKQMTEEDKKEFYDAENPKVIKQRELVKFWSYCQMNEIDKLKGEKPIDEYRLEKAVESGSKAAVMYCLEETNLRSKKDAIVDAAEEAVRCKLDGLIYARDDWLLFGNESYEDGVESRVPNDYYVDILCYLLSKMGEDQLVSFLKKDIKGVKYETESHIYERRCSVLEYFLNWPYQIYFMKTAGSIWNYLEDSDFALLLLRMCNKIGTAVENLRYGEDKSYDYRKLFREFWHESPERYKRYVFSNEKLVYRGDRTFEVKAGVGLLSQLLTLRHFTDEDKENIRLILASATNEEKRNIFSSKEWSDICIELMREKKWETLDRFVLNCFSSEEQADDYKKVLSYTAKAHRICINFVKNDERDEAEAFIRWSASSEEKKDQLKRKMIRSEYGTDVCFILILRDGNIEAFDTFVRWFLRSEEEAKTFRKELIFSDSGVQNCADCVTGGQSELITEFINWSLSSEEEVRELKKKVAYTVGSSHLVELISDYLVEGVCDEQGSDDKVGCTINFRGGKWEEVEKFLNWCFSSEEEISEFKKQKLLVESGEEIHFNLIKCIQWEEAKRFFEWLGLSAEEVKELKKKTLFYHEAAIEMFCELVSSEEGDERFAAYGNKEEAITLLLRWYLTDKETTLEYKDEFRNQNIDLLDEVDLKNFDSMIEQCLRALELKKKSETFSPSKSLCNLKL